MIIKLNLKHQTRLKALKGETLELTSEKLG